MISSELIGKILLNKYVLGSVTVLISLLVAYFKGSAAAKRDAAAEQAIAEKAQQARIRAAEAKNAHLEKQGEKQNEKINSGSTIDDLLGMWNESQPPKGPGSDPGKNS